MAGKKDNRSDIYLRTKTAAFHSAAAITRMAAGGFFTFIFGLGVFFCISGYDNGSFRPDFPVYALLFFFALLLLISGIMGYNLVRAARRYEMIFAEARDALVTVRELEDQTGKSPRKIMKELRYLFRKRYFRGCTLVRRGDQAGVRLTDAAREI